MRRSLDIHVCRALIVQDTQVVEYATSLNSEETYLCSAVRAELERDAYAQRYTGPALRKVRRLYERFESLPTNDEVAGVYGLLHVKVAPGTDRDLELMTLAVALPNSLCVATTRPQAYGSLFGNFLIESWTPSGSEDPDDARV